MHLYNADNAVDLWGCTFTTLSDVTLGTTGPRGNAAGHQNGHKGLSLAAGSDNLVQRFEVNAPLVHDVSISGYESGSVFANGYGADLNLDFHRSSPYANLFTNINHGLGNRPLESGGSPKNGALGGVCVCGGGALRVWGVCGGWEGGRVFEGSPRRRPRAQSHSSHH